MTSVLVDSNVLLDVATEDAKWGSWSAQALETVASTAALVINPIIYAEISIGYRTVEEVEEAFPAEAFRRDHLPYEAAFLAGKAFVRYRRRGGRRALPLPDFFIGAHAAIAGYTLLTRDATRYRTYFPALKIIAP